MARSIKDFVKSNQILTDLYYKWESGEFSFYELVYKKIKALYYLQKFGRDLKLNIGGGPEARTEGWLVVDYSLLGIVDFISSNVHINENVAKGIPLADGSVNAIYASHFLEHLTWFEGARFLRECFRVLSKGGKLRILIPNGDIFVKKFIEKDIEFFKDPSKCLNEWRGNITDTFAWGFVGAFFRNKRNYGRHAMFYNEENLTYRLNEIGFNCITRRAFNESGYKEFSDEYKFFPDRKIPREVGAINLIIEAAKG